MSDAAQTLSAGPAPTVKPKVSRDDWGMRLFMGIIAIYLAVTLVLPLYAMLSKSFSTYKVDLGGYGLQIDTGTGWGDETTLEALNAKQGAFKASDLAGSSDTRLSPLALFPDFSFRSPTKYRLKNLRPDVVFLFGSELVADADWHEYTSNDFRRISLRPVKDIGASNYLRYFSTPSLF
ncbi:MAG: putative 2-aminoethylphosphonate ABC transporter permease subunit, partial [Rhizobiales bacterium]|nr:putative 2-aminoethylphosphonate ABC transporter permease subunit [Hyphomicrobiales bacterium]